MYNGIESASVKGTGLSGYVQRSKAAVSQISKFRAAEYSDDAPPPAANPLEALRSAKENRELAARLQQHEALRAIALKVLLYREEREGLGLPPEVVDRECHTLRDTLARAHADEASEEKRRAQAEAEAKTAERFATAFRVRAGAIGEAFDRAQREEEKERAEEEWKKSLEEQIAERVKRVRGE